MDDLLTQRLAQADRLAKQARRAAQAGNHQEAQKLRAQIDRLYDALEEEFTAPAQVAQVENSLPKSSFG